jgi:hypothetical protein
VLIRRWRQVETTDAAPALGFKTTDKLVGISSAKMSAESPARCTENRASSAFIYKHLQGLESKLFGL